MGAGEQEGGQPSSSSSTSTSYKVVVAGTTGLLYYRVLTVLRVLDMQVAMFVTSLGLILRALSPFAVVLWTGHVGLSLSNPAGVVPRR